MIATARFCVDINPLKGITPSGDGNINMIMKMDKFISTFNGFTQSGNENLRLDAIIMLNRWYDPDYDDILDDFDESHAQLEQEYENYDTDMGCDLEDLDNYYDDINDEL